MNLNVDAAIRILETVGFPTAVALWFMFRTDRKIEEQTKATTEHTIAINRLASLMEKWK